MAGAGGGRRGRGVRLWRTVHVPPRVPMGDGGERVPGTRPPADAVAGARVRGAVRPACEPRTPHRAGGHRPAQRRQRGPAPRDGLRARRHLPAGRAGSTADGTTSPGTSATSPRTTARPPRSAERCAGATYSVGVPRSVARPDDQDVVRDSYDRVAESYVAMGLGELAAYPWLRAALAAFAEDVRERGPVVDVGCGPGHVTAHLAGLGVDVRGVDLSPRMVEQARRLHPNASVRRRVPLPRPPPSTTLPSAACSAGGRRSTCPATSCRTSSRPSLPRLAPGGQVLIGTHVGDGDVVRTEAYGGVPVEWTTHLWQPEQLAALLADAGLELVAELRLPANLFGNRKWRSPPVVQADSCADRLPAERGQGTWLDDVPAGTSADPVRGFGGLAPPS